MLHAQRHKIVRRYPAQYKLGVITLMSGLAGCATVLALISGFETWPILWSLCALNSAVLMGLGMVLVIRGRQRVQSFWRDRPRSWP